MNGPASQSNGLALPRVGPCCLGGRISPVAKLPGGVLLAAAGAFRDIGHFGLSCSSDWPYRGGVAAQKMCPPSSLAAAALEFSPIKAADAKQHQTTPTQ